MTAQTSIPQTILLPVRPIEKISELPNAAHRAWRSKKHVEVFDRKDAQRDRMMSPYPPANQGNRFWR
jgi:hypothetical protein